MTPRLYVLLTALLLVAPAHTAQPPDKHAAQGLVGVHVLGPAEGVLTGDPGPRDDAVLWENHDGTFENGYCWDWTVLEEPYQGAFAEGFMGPADVVGVRIYLTGVSTHDGDDVDIFVWGSGVEGPGPVLAMVSYQGVEQPPFWPEVRPYDFEIQAPVGQVFYVGLWDVPTLYGCPISWFICADEDGPYGAPWTYIPLESGYDPGWHSPDTVWGVTSSLGIGVYVQATSGVQEGTLRPVEKSTTWGAIKALF